MNKTLVARKAKDMGKEALGIVVLRHVFYCLVNPEIRLHFQNFLPLPFLYLHYFKWVTLFLTWTTVISCQSHFPISHSHFGNASGISFILFNFQGYSDIGENVVFWYYFSSLQKKFETFTKIQGYSIFITTALHFISHHLLVVSTTVRVEGSIVTAIH